MHQKIGLNVISPHPQKAIKANTRAWTDQISSSSKSKSWGFSKYVFDVLKGNWGYLTILCWFQFYSETICWFYRSRSKRVNNIWDQVTKTRSWKTLMTAEMRMSRVSHTVVFTYSSTATRSSFSSRFNNLTAQEEGRWLKHSESCRHSLITTIFCIQ